MILCPRLVMRRSILLYLFGVVTPGLMLLYLAVQSVERQRQAIATLAKSNHALGAEKLAARVQQRSRELTSECLKQRTGCEIATHFFTFQDRGLISPRIRSVTRSDQRALPPAFLGAETLEFQPGRLEDALIAYRAAHDSAASTALRALALSRIARCLHKLHRKKEVFSAWQQLLRDYGGLYDPVGRPYSLTARFELGQVEGIYDELVHYRWDISAEQFDYYMNLLNRKPPVGNRFDPTIRFFNHATVSLNTAAILLSGKVVMPSRDTILISG